MLSNKWIAGFTLVEFIIAMSLVGIITVVGFSGIWSANRSWNAVEARIDASEELRTVHGFLRRHVSQARTIFMVQEERLAVVFKGDEKELRFVAPAPLQQGVPGRLYLYSLAFSPTGDRRTQLSLAFADYFPGMEELPEFGERLTLLPRLSEGEMDYFGKADVREEADWWKRWERTEALPELVRLRFREEGEDEWQTLVIAIKGDSA